MKPQEEKVEQNETEEELQQGGKLEALPKRQMQEVVTDVILEGKNIYTNGKITDRLITRIVFPLESGKRFTHKPFRYDNDSTKIDFEFTFVDTEKKKGVSFKELPIKITELHQAVRKYGKVEIQTSVTPFLKTSLNNEGVIEKTEYLTLNYKDIQDLMIVIQKKK